MNVSPPEPIHPSTGTRPDDLPRSSWAASLADLAAARIAIIEHESRAAATSGIRKAVLLVAAGLTGLFAWLLLIVALVGIIAATAGWAWHWVTLGFALIHLLAGALLFLKVKKHGTQSFSLTRAEFQKDREWLHSLKQTRKSSN